MFTKKKDLFSLSLCLSVPIKHQQSFVLLLEIGYIDAVTLTLAPDPEVAQQQTTAMGALPPSPQGSKQTLLRCKKCRYNAVCYLI